MSKRARLVIDLQNGVGPLISFDGLIDKVNRLIVKYRQQGLPIIFIQHEEAGLEANTEDCQLVSTLSTLDSDYYVRKTHADSFYHTELSPLLQQLNVEQLEICGAEIKTVFNRGYQLFMHHGAISSEHDTLLSDYNVV